jgi:signal transduction histidine kinase
VLNDLLAGDHVKAGERQVCLLPWGIQALICLVENALQFTPPGRDVTIGVTASPPALTVRDSGMGFAAGDGAARSAAGGGDVHAGLGLRIARQVAVAHKAELDIARAPEGGAAVSLRFPDPGRP